MSYYQDIMKYGSCEYDNIEELESPPMVTLTREEWVAIQERLDREVIEACKTKIWIDPKLYNPTEREKPYVVGTIDNNGGNKK